MSTRRPRKTVWRIEGHDGSTTEGWSVGDLAELTTDFENARDRLRVGWIGTVEIVDNKALWVRFQHTDELHRLYTSDVLPATVADESASVVYEDDVQVLPSRLFGTVLRVGITQATVQLWGAGHDDDGCSRFIVVAITDLRMIVRAE